MQSKAADIAGSEQKTGKAWKGFSRSTWLKIALFATGLSGIVAEYILSTLATYFLGDSVMQWTLIVSVMLFSMGIGSRFSRGIKGNLLETFVGIELVLSLLVAFSSLTVYLASAYTAYTGFLIYSLSIAIGILIGMEIPLVIRLNERFESLRVNVASVMEKDYLGSLAGGVLFAFVLLPFLGLTYTPFLLGLVNFSVAMILVFVLWKEIGKPLRLGLVSGSVLTLALILGGLALAKPIVLHGEQKRYKDKVIFSKQSRYQQIVITQWKDHYWLYLNSNQQLSTLDEVMYHEPLVHPVMQLHPAPQNVLVLGGGDGCAVRELLKYPAVEGVTLVDLDPEMTRLGREHPVLTELNEGAFEDKRVRVVNDDGYHFLEQNEAFYDLIIMDLPDPKTVELGRLYSYEFYSLCRRHLRPNGLLVTQAGSPYYATKAFQCIGKTLKEAGFGAVPLHNQILTLGEWGWWVAARDAEEQELKQALQNLQFQDVETEWINQEAMMMMTSFGKVIYPNAGDSVEVNYVHDPVLYRYYLKGNWDLY